MRECHLNSWFHERRNASVDEVSATWNSSACRGHEWGQMELDDSDLWQRSGQDDTRAFAILFERHAKAIYNFCFRRTSAGGVALR